jgi:hypothetical protein
MITESPDCLASSKPAQIQQSDYCRAEKKNAWSADGTTKD